jgi:hypothetical protein
MSDHDGCGVAKNGKRAADRWLICAGAAVTALTAIWLLLRRLARRSGVAGVDLVRSLPGDDLVGDPQIVIDRAVVFDAAPAEVWPWIVQLGKARAGWYVPAWLERWTDGTALSGARTIDGSFQDLAEGDIVPDYGPGSGKFRVVTLRPPRALVYLSMRDPAADWGWPEPEEPLPDGALTFSWAMILDELDRGRCRLLVRLRMKRVGQRTSPLFRAFAGLVDYVTIALMAAGLRERLRGE